MTAKEFLQGRFMRHPIHPLLVHVPVGAWILSLAFDIIAVAGGGESFVRAAQYTLVGGLIGAALAAIFGTADLFTRTPRNSKPRRIGLTHMTLNVCVLALYVVNAALRWDNLDFARPPPLPFVLSVVGVVLLLVSGYLGGSLIYQHGIGLTLDKTETEEKVRLGHTIRQRPIEVHP